MSKTLAINNTTSFGAVLNLIIKRMPAYEMCNYKQCLLIQCNLLC